MRWMVGVLLLMSVKAAFASGPYKVAIDALDIPAASVDTTPAFTHLSRGAAALLAVTLGPFGGHRIYLGTGAKVPLLYGLTFGGFGVLVVIDLGHILFTRDLEAYRNSDQVLMWAKPPAH